VTVGKVVSGLLLGIMLSRPAASLIADATSWHVVFGGAAVMVTVVAFVLRAKLPLRQPNHHISYPKLMGSLWHLFQQTPVLRRRAAYHAGIFGSFSLFWTVTPLMLAGPCSTCRRPASPSSRWSAWPVRWPRRSPASWPTRATR
jgi:predicted MFS family arabinose efflux permease